MFHRKNTKANKTKKTVDPNDPFGLNVDFNDIKFDESALEKELAGMLGTEEIDEEPAVSRNTASSKNFDISMGCDVDEDDVALMTQLKAHLAVSGDEDSTPSDSETQPIHSALLTVIKERHRALEEVVSEMKAVSLDEMESADLHRYEIMLTSVENIAAKAEQGLPVNIDELPPLPPAFKGPSRPHRKSAQDIVLDYVTESEPKAVPKKPAPVPAKQKATALAQLKSRLVEYRNAAALAKSEGKTTRLQELTVAVNFISEAVSDVESGRDTFDPDDMPPPPDQFSLPPETRAEIMAQSSSQSPAAASSQPSVAAVDPATEALVKAAASAVVSRASLTARIRLLEGMIQTGEDLDKSRYRRVFDSYNTALRAYDAGVNYNYGVLNPLPGCPKFTSVAPAQPMTSAGAAAGTPTVPGAASTSFPNRTVELLQKRQAELRNAAAQAKSRGDMVSAKDFLRSSLSLNNMIKAAGAGLSVDLKQLPPAPGSGSGAGRSVAPQPVLSGEATDPPVEFQVVLESIDQNPLSLCNLITTHLQWQADEAAQLSRCHREAGFTTAADKYFELEDISRKWINLVEVRKQRGRVPDYTFEVANLSLLNRNLDLGDDVLEVTVVRGISFPLPPGISTPLSLDTFVSMELPFPSRESPQTYSTEWARHTNEPTNFGGPKATARFEINRKARSYERLLSGIKTLKVMVNYNRGLLKKSGVLGTASVKLNDLVASATHTACYELMDDRKAVGGLLELCLRHRAPLRGPDVVPFQKPWLCLTNPKNPPKRHDK